MLSHSKVNDLVTHMLFVRDERLLRHFLLGLSAATKDCRLVR
jgi:hypothetical protein